MPLWLGIVFAVSLLAGSFPCLGAEAQGESNSAAQLSALPPAEPQGSLTDTNAELPAELATVITGTTLPEELVADDLESGVVPIVIDNDEAIETTGTLEYKELPTDKGGTKIIAGARFPVVLVTAHTSKNAKKGDPVQARLKYQLKIADRVVAKKGDIVNGHIHYVMRARTILHSFVSAKRWYRNSGALGITFDEIVASEGEHLPLEVRPARKSRIVKNKAAGRVLGVNHDGIIVGPWSQQLRYKAIRVGLNAALAPAGVFSFGAMPVALGVIGAANPSFAFSKPVGLNVRHRRLKGFAWGFLSGIPGSWLIEDTTVKGQECILKPGDEFLCEFKAEFTGEPATDAVLLPGATTSVRGQVVNQDKGRKPEKSPAGSRSVDTTPRERAKSSGPGTRSERGGSGGGKVRSRRSD